MGVMRILPTLSRLIAFVALLTVACGVNPSGSGGDGNGDPPGPSEPPGDPGDPGDPGGNDDPPSQAGTIVLLVGDPGDLNESERQLRDYLGGFGREVRIVDDDGFSLDRVDGCDVVVMSKTISSTNVADRLRPTTCGVVFWEDNQQMIHMMATIDNDGSSGTAWHATENDVYIRPDAPGSLRAGLSGEHDIYTSHDEITYAPRNDLVDDAVVIAEFDESGGNPSIYVLERGARLANGSGAAGRRVYFGLYDDTYRLLNDNGRALFDAAFRWAME